MADEVVSNQNPDKGETPPEGGEGKGGFSYAIDDKTSISGKDETEFTANLEKYIEGATGGGEGDAAIVIPTKYGTIQAKDADDFKVKLGELITGLKTGKGKPADDFDFSKGIDEGFGVQGDEFGGEFIGQSQSQQGFGQFQASFEPPVAPRLPKWDGDSEEYFGLLGKYHEKKAEHDKNLIIHTLDLFMQNFMGQMNDQTAGRKVNATAVYERNFAKAMADQGKNPGGSLQQARNILINNHPTSIRLNPQTGKFEYAKGALELAAKEMTAAGRKESDSRREIKAQLDYLKHKGSAAGGGTGGGASDIYNELERTLKQDLTPDNVEKIKKLSAKAGLD